MGTNNNKWTAADLPNLSGRTVVVTGASNGRGAITPRELAGAGVPYLEAYEGYPLGAKSLSEEESYLETLWEQGAAYNIQSAGWGNESWAKAPAS